MDFFELRTDRLVLNELRASDIDAIAAYCAEPVFEHFMTTPWPYERHHAEWFVDTGAPQGWTTSVELTWAIRTSDNGPLWGTICVRLRGGSAATDTAKRTSTGHGSLGYWLGADRRGNGIMSEAAQAVVAATFDRTDVGEVRWECVAENVASMHVARSAGFSYTGEAIGEIPGRAGEPVASWTAAIRRDGAAIQPQVWPA